MNSKRDFGRAGDTENIQGKEERRSGRMEFSKELCDIKCGVSFLHFWPDFLFILGGVFLFFPPKLDICFIS